MRTVRLAAAALLCGGLFPLGAVAPAACAAEGPHAVLVVDTDAPGGEFRYCVALPDGSVTGIELIQLANDQHGLQYRLGYGGNAVCQLAGVGYDSDECLEEGPEFWGYWRGDGSGGWDWSSSGGNATTVRDGDVEGWAWGTGNDGSSHPSPPATTFESVCGARSGGDPPATDDDGGKAGKGSTRARPERRGSTNAAGSGSSTAARAEKEPTHAKDRARDDRDKDPRAKAKRKKRKNEPAPAYTLRPSPTTSSPPAGPIASEPTSSDGGPPAGATVAAVATVGLIVAGAVVQRRRLGAR
ncbi:MAG: hypothetical protein KY391_07015 [Actinobacteria bacterium]|nr:hypothetical protein [Actinomycetota bacterium]